MPFLIFYDDPDGVPGNGGGVWHGSESGAAPAAGNLALPLMGVGRAFLLAVTYKLLKIIGIGSSI